MIHQHYRETFSTGNGEYYIDDDDDEGRINFSMALSPNTTRTHNNKLKQ